MKVICIDASPGKETKIIPPFREMDILDVVDSWVYSNAYHIPKFPLAPNGTQHHWLKSRFIPLSNIDEMELVNTEQFKTYKQAGATFLIPDFANGDIDREEIEYEAGMEEAEAFAKWVRDNEEMQLVNFSI